MCSKVDELQQLPATLAICFLSLENLICPSTAAVKSLLTVMALLQQKP